MNSGRVCPLHYRYPSSVFSQAATIHAHTIYVIGGLYGNLAALDAIHLLAANEPVKPILIFNGDFNWFNVNLRQFQAINNDVLNHIALRGNVETELASLEDDGCGCAYPDYVDDADVARSNEIMARLRQTARQHPSLINRLSALPMHAVAQVGNARIGIVHGDAESLAGWRFAHDALHDVANQTWLATVCRDNQLAGFASSHTCLPTFRRFSLGAERHFVINNGAAGMPNFGGTAYGLLTRISVDDAAEGLSQYGEVINGIHIDAIPVHYDSATFTNAFISDWPLNSAAHTSYYRRITDGPNYAPPHALGLVKSAAQCG
jgi:hypothetical protein